MPKDNAHPQRKGRAGERIRDHQAWVVVRQRELAGVLRCEMFHEEGRQVRGVRPGGHKPVVLGMPEGQVGGDECGVATGSED